MRETANNDKKNAATSRRERPMGLTHSMGKLPPQAVDLEEAVLGALMLEKDAILEIADFMRPEVFYKDAHQKIYAAIQFLQSLSEPVDILTVTAQLRQQGDLEMIGGAYYITELTARVSSSANIERHARIIVQKFIQRELIRSATETINDAYEDTVDVFDLISKIEGSKDALLEGLTSRQESSNEDVFIETLKQLEKQGKVQDGLTGVPSGFYDVDKITAGWQPSDLIILAARPAMGKSAFALQSCLNAAFDFNIPGAFFSLEMSNVQLMRRQLAIMCEIHLEHFRKGTLTDFDWTRIHEMARQIQAAPIHWDDTPNISIVELCAKARRLKRKFDIKFLIIDYLQLMIGHKQNSSGTREQEVSSVSRALKGLAKELDIPIIALSQLSRAVESRPGNLKRPMLSDLRESGAIEQDADVVMFLYRPEYYGITEDEAGGSTIGMAELIIAKHRNGSTEDVPLRFVAKYTSFKSVEFDIPEISGPGYTEPPLEPEKPHGFTLKPNENFDDDNVPF